MKLSDFNSEAILAELIGTFGLTFAVLMGLTSSSLGLETGVIAAMTLGVFVLVIGPVSGSHINPAVTISQYTVGKINLANSLGYIFAQLSGALLALVTLSLFNNGNIFELGAADSIGIFWAEALGTFIFGFAIAATIYNKLDPVASALAVGGGLFVGILFASVTSTGLLNPAVALGVGSLTWPYVVGPIVGGVAGMNTYRLLLKSPKKKR